jgi:hypothetical protein
MPLYPGNMDQSEDLNAIQTATDAAAGYVRNLYIAFLGFAAYLTITVASISDQQLLQAAPVRLPLLDVEIPLPAFFFVAPILFMTFHANLLLQARILAEKLYAWNREVTKRESSRSHDSCRLRLHIFIFSQMLVGNSKGLLRSIFVAMSWLTFVVLPLAVLTIVQVQFLPYHNLPITWLHRLLIIVDGLAIIFLWAQSLSQRRPDGDGTDRTDVLHRHNALLRWPYLVSILIALIFAVFSIWKATIPKERFFVFAIDACIDRQPPTKVLHPLLDLGGRYISSPEVNFVRDEAAKRHIRNYGERRAWVWFSEVIEIRPGPKRDLSYAELSKSNLQAAGLSEVTLCNVILNVRTSS